MKYVVLAVIAENQCFEVPFMFPDIVVHSDFVKFAKMQIREQFPTAKQIKPVAAGVLNSMDMMVRCTGGSESLGLESRPEDSNLISMCDYGSMYA